MKNTFITFFTLSYLCISIANAATKYNGNSDDQCSCSRGADAVNNTTRKITLKQAKALVWAALTPKQSKLPGLEIFKASEKDETLNSYQDSFNSRFVTFYVIWGRTTEGSDTVGHFSIDPYTGDVFDKVAGCWEYKNKKLKTLQKEIRRSLHLTQVKYHKLKTAGPECNP